MRSCTSYHRTTMASPAQISRIATPITALAQSRNAMSNNIANSSSKKSPFSTASFTTKPSITHRRQKPMLSSSRGRSFTAVAASSSTRELRVSHILLNPDDTQLMEELTEKIKSGSETLANLAAKHSSCPSNAGGGDIGFISKGQTVPEFEAAAFGSQVGDITTCKTQFGLHILQVTEEREPVTIEVQDMYVEQLKEMLDVATANGGPGDIQFIDVREDSELAIASLPHFQVLSTSKFQEWAPIVGEILDKERPVVVLCHHGMRSMQVALFLTGQGFKDVRNVTGGINAWTLVIDKNVPAY